MSKKPATNDVENAALCNSFDANAVSALLNMFWESREKSNLTD